MIYRLALSIILVATPWMSHADKLESSWIQYSYHDLHSKINEIYDIQFSQENSNAVLSISMAPPDQFYFRGYIYRCKQFSMPSSALRIRVKILTYHPDKQVRVVDDLIERLSNDSIEGYADSENFVLFLGKNTANLIFPMINPSVIPLIDCNEWKSNVK